ncbi:heat shock transcription factor, Y-linked-like [Tachyglossus aculeatus]|uniref:heat shock transcription factor, Y-linked-like n=1 Tax=Tachyglossus aculeatus TaxID=9261 RepID=UPI0018F3D3C7|nr:heat shock transcription factor, Y-linked-like [Tachyglossus aculeatus]
MEEMDLDLTPSIVPEGSPQAGPSAPQMDIDANISSLGSLDDSELRELVEEKAFQTLAEEPLVKRHDYSLCDAGSVNDNQLHFLTFSKKLWKLVESDEFKSISWDDDGNFVVINEELFKTEILGRKGHLKIFETECMKSFIQQLNFCGFTRMQLDFQRSASLAEFLAEENEVSALSKLQFYYSPNFQRQFPELMKKITSLGVNNVYSPTINQMIRNATEKPQDQVEASQPTGKKSSSKPPNEDQQKLNNKNPVKPNPTRPQPESHPSVAQVISVEKAECVAAGENGRLNQPEPAPLPVPQSSPILVNAQNVVLPVASSPVYHIIPVSQDSSFTSLIGIPVFQIIYPNLVVVPTNLPGVLPVYNLWFSVPVVAVPSAIPMASAPQAVHHHCPTCNCFASQVLASPDPPESMGATGFHN